MARSRRFGRRLKRRKVYRRKGRSRRRLGRRRSGRGRMVTTNGFVTRFNPQRIQRLTAVKTDYAWNVMTGAGATVQEVGTFDPQGTYGTHGSGMPQFSDYDNLYDFYKPKKMVFTFTYVNLESTDDAVIPELFVRWNYDIDWLTASLLDLENRNDWKHITFRNDARCASFTVYPRVQVPQYNSGGVFASQTLGPRKCGWTGVSYGTQCYGYAMLIPFLAVNQAIRVDVTYHVQFKSQR